MTFLRPTFLWLLLGVAALVAAYVVLQRRRRHYAVRFTNLDLLASVAPQRPGWRRHVPAGIVAFALIASVLGLARPAREVQVAKKSAIVMLVVDVSASMAATDVEPSRLQAAIKAGVAFVDGLPATFQVGLVSFDSHARVLVNPTEDHRSVTAAIEQLHLGRGTAAGDSILTALDAVTAAQRAIGANLRRPTSTDGNEPLSATIVLLSDGGTTTGPDPLDAARTAGAANVPVSTITYGTAGGTVVINGQVVPVPPDSQAMRQIARLSGGQSYDATNTTELDQVYAKIQGAVGHTTEQREIVVWFLAIALILMTIACIASMVWTGRFL